MGWVRILFARCGWAEGGWWDEYSLSTGVVVRRRQVRRRCELLVSTEGLVLERREPLDRRSVTVVEMPGKALMPGFVNAHSHSFQRLIRGKAESRVLSGRDFWSWRGTMYFAASQLNPQQVYDVARMAFLEMVLAGTTTVGEFHYLHNAPDGKAYEDPNLLGKQVIAAAESVGDADCAAANGVSARGI